MFQLSNMDGFTVAHLDKVMSPYIEMSYNEYYKEYQTIALSTLDVGKMSADEYKKSLDRINHKAEVYATGKVRGEVYQGVQALEHKLNTIPSSRGDFAFVTCTFGLGSDKWSKMFSEALLDVRAKGQGEPTVPVLFPKLVFITDLDGLHGEGKSNHDLWLKACDTANVCMYPDQLSVSNPDDYVGHIYKKYGKAISPMGCRAFLSPFCVNKKTGEWSFKEEDPNEWEFIVEGRYNLGAISLNLCMIMAKAIEESGFSLTSRSYSSEELSTIRKKFFELLTYYMRMIEDILIRTYDYISEMPASANPVMFTQGLAWGGTLKPDEKIGKILMASTSSFGYVGLNELQELFNGKSLVEDGDFAYETLCFMNDYKDAAKERDNINFAVYRNAS
jgi:ribonucleoside-triphosphate reductase